MYKPLLNSWIPALFATIGLTSTTLALPTDPYTLDPSFNGAAAIEDRFAGGANAAYHAQKLVRLGNDRKVVAGLVPQFQQPNQGNGRYALGLVQYGPDGERLAWSNPTPGYIHYENRYLIYPRLSSGNPGHFTAVRDIKAVAGYIFVLIDYQAGTGNGDADILVFGEDGALVAHYLAFSSSFDETGAGLAIYSVPNCNGVLACTKIIAVASYVAPGGRSIITAKRYTVGTGGPPAFTPTGELIIDTAFGQWGNGAEDYLAPDSLCFAQTQCSVVATGVSAVRTQTGAPTIYVGAQARWSGEDSDTTVLAIFGPNGVAIPGFGTNGFARHPINAGSSRRESVIGVVAVAGDGGPISDRIYAVSDVAMPCAFSRGVGVVKLTGNGARDLAFGNSGYRVFGGSSDPACSQMSMGGTEPAGVTLDGERLVVVGAEHFFAPVFGPEPEPFIAVVDASRGAVREMRIQRPLRANGGGAYWGGASWQDVVANGNGVYTATGLLIDTDVNLPLFGTVRFASDRIFGNDFQ